MNQELAFPLGLLTERVCSTPVEQARYSCINLLFSMPHENSDEAIETVADGLRLQVGDLPGDYAPTLLKAEPAAYVVGFTAGVSRALDVPVGNHTIRTLERGTRQGLPREGDLGQRLADIATGIILDGSVTSEPNLDEMREKGEAEGRAFVEDRKPPSLLKDLIFEE